MSVLRNLVSNQFQFGNIVFGRGTTVNVETFDEKPYDVNATDFQLGRNDEVYFGQDQLKPTTIELTFNVRYNWLLPRYAGMIPNFWAEMPTVADFKEEWRADIIRKDYGAVKPLYVCDRNGLTKAVFGRPGAFTNADNSDYTEAVQCIAEFRRMDTQAYGVIENRLLLSQAQPSAVINGTGGDAPTWLRMLIVGPVNHPVISIGNTYLRGDIELELDYNVAINEVVEISSYPWSRFVANNAIPRINLSRKLIGQSPYLDRMQIGPKAVVPVSLSGGSMNTDTKVQVCFYNAYQVAR